MKLAHSSPLGPLEIPTVPTPVEPGEPFDVPDEIAESLLEQTDLFWRVNPIDLLRAEAATYGIDTTGMKKADITAAIAEAVEAEADPADAAAADTEEDPK